MTDDKLIRLLKLGAWGGAGDEEMALAADRIEALVKDLGKAEDRERVADHMAAKYLARAERLEAALRAIQTYLAEPAPEDKINDLKGDLRWISHRVNAALNEAADRIEQLKDGLEAVATLQVWLEDNLPYQIWEAIPTNIWNDVTALNVRKAADRIEALEGEREAAVRQAVDYCDCHDFRDGGLELAVSEIIKVLEKKKVPLNLSE